MVKFWASIVRSSGCVGVRIIVCIVHQAAYKTLRIPIDEMDKLVSATGYSESQKVGTWV